MRDRQFSWRSAEREIVWIMGVIDQDALACLRVVLADALDRSPGPLTVDLSEVDHLPTAALQILGDAGVGAAAVGRSLHVRAREDSVAAQVLRTLGHPFDEVRLEVADPRVSGGSPPQYLG